MKRDAEMYRREDEQRMKQVETVHELESLINQVQELLIEVRLLVIVLFVLGLCCVGVLAV